MIPMAFGWGEGGEQTAPLGRAVIGGLVAATFATLFVLPSIFALVQGRIGRYSASVDPDDPESRYFDHLATSIPAVATNCDTRNLAAIEAVASGIVHEE
jgi:hypothetical protein